MDKFENIKPKNYSSYIKSLNDAELNEIYTKIYDERKNDETEDGRKCYISRIIYIEMNNRRMRRFNNMDKERLRKIMKLSAIL